MTTDVIQRTYVQDTHQPTNVTYDPFGALKGATYGNTLAETRAYDLVGRLGTIIAPGKQNQTDIADNLTTVTDTLRAL